MKRKDRQQREEGGPDRLSPEDIRDLRREDDKADESDDDDFYLARRDSGVRRHRGRPREDKRPEDGYGG
jgi:hypothetical protein